MRGGIFIRRRNAHQALDIQTMGVARGLDQGVGLIGQDAGLLGLSASVDLDQNAGRTAQLGRRDRQGPRQFFAVQRLDDVEQGHRVLSLVGLQRADQAKLQPRQVRQTVGPTAFSLLHPVFAEHPLARGQNGVDGLGALRLGYSRQDHRGGVAACRLTGRVDTAADGGDPFSDGRRR